MVIGRRPRVDDGEHVDERPPVLLVGCASSPADLIPALSITLSVFYSRVCQTSRLFRAAGLALDRLLAGVPSAVRVYALNTAKSVSQLLQHQCSTSTSSRLSLAQLHTASH